jgi:hypothetical protein
MTILELLEPNITPLQRELLLVAKQAAETYLHAKDAQLQDDNEKLAALNQRLTETLNQFQQVMDAGA